MPRKTTTSAPATTKYENNPFFVAGNGITLLFDSARGVAVVLLLLSIFSFMGNGFSGDDKSDETSWNEMTSAVSGWTANDWVIAGGAVAIIGMALIMVSALLGGVSSYASMKLSRGENVKLSEAFRVAFDRLWSFLWLQILIFVKILLWSLLFVIPGVIMAIRYTLAGVAFFDDRKHLKGNAAIKESLRLTKGGWLTTFSSNVLFNILTFGILSSVVTTGANTVLYRQFNALGDKPKPSAHWLSWVTLALPIIIAFLVLAMLIALIAGVAIGASGGVI